MNPEQQWFTNATDARARALSEEDALRGDTLISLETTAEADFGFDLKAYVEAAPENFIKTIRLMSAEDQQVLLEYFVLGKSQQTQGILHDRTQTIMSFISRMAQRRFAALLMFGGTPTRERMAELLTKYGHEDNKTGVPLSTLIEDYRGILSFTLVAGKHFRNHVDVRRALLDFAKLEPTEPELAALSAYVGGLVFRMSALGAGRAERERERFEKPIHHRDPEVIGEFVVTTDAPGREHVLTTRGTR